MIIEETIDGQIKETTNLNELKKAKDENSIKEVIKNQYQDKPITISKNIQNNFFVSTLEKEL